MKILKLEQGSEQWLKSRQKHFCASEAPAMMGCSPYMTRSQLLDLKKGKPEEKSTGKQAEIFQKGHHYEAKARAIVEINELEAFPPVVGALYQDDLPLLASMDGLGSKVFEHKSWNKTLADNIRAGVLADHYIWQLEQQLLVSGAGEALFVASDGTEEKMVSLIYRSEPKRRAALIAGWKQFAKDLASHTLAAKPEPLIIHARQRLPALVATVVGGDITSNADHCLKQMKILAQKEMERPLESDQDFAEKEQLNKQVKAARAKLKKTVEDVEDAFVSFADFSKVARALDSVLQKMQSDGERKVRQEKQQRREAIIKQGMDALQHHIEQWQEQIPLEALQGLPLSRLELAPLIKGKRNLASIRDAVEVAVANHKILLDNELGRAQDNLTYLNRVAADYQFLFQDVAQLVMQESEPFQGQVQLRIAHHQQDRAKRKARRKQQQDQQQTKNKETRRVMERSKDRCPPLRGALPEDGTVINISYTTRTSIRYDRFYPGNPRDKSGKKGRWMMMNRDCKWEPFHGDPHTLQDLNY
ncbi:MAG: YqaJ viral recombinase family protein [Magnetococcales bacterium]|nr:YqaJ viral recombinase family protein [Magnetococcales bacterium]